MTRLPEFELRRAASLAEAVAWLGADPRARLLAGGTDLVPNLRHGISGAPILVDLGGVRDLSEMACTDAGLALGAGVTLARLGTDTAIAQRYPALAEAARAVAGPSHRSVATLAGNLCQDTRCVYYNQSAWWRAANQYCLKLDGDTCHVAPQGHRCHAAFSGDLAPALLVLGAEVELVGPLGARLIPLAELYRDDGAAHLTLARDEVLASVRVPAAAPAMRCGYRKARTRAAMDFALAGVACALTLRDGAITDLRVAITGTNSNPFLLVGCEACAGRRVDAELLAQLGKLVQKQVSPMRSTVTASNHRRLVAAALAQRLVRELAGAAFTGVAG
jgi:4-hydroxybenzoyl-CoA reductase subunit beta